MKRPNFIIIIITATLTSTGLMAIGAHHLNHHSKCQHFKGHHQVYNQNTETQSHHQGLHDPTKTD